MKKSVQLWQEVHGDMSKSPFTLFLIDDELPAIDITAGTDNANQDLKALKDLKDALIKESKEGLFAVVLLGLPMSEESFNEYSIPNEDIRWREFRALLGNVGSNGILICDVMWTTSTGDNKIFFEHVRKAAEAQLIPSDSIATLTKNNKWQNNKNFQKNDSGVVAAVLAWVRSRTCLYHPCHSITRLMHAYMLKEPSEWTHNTLNKCSDMFTFAGVNIINDETRKALFMLDHSTNNVFPAVWDNECLKIEKIAGMDGLRGLVEALQFPCEVKWPDAENLTGLLLPCMPGLFFLLSLRAFVASLEEQQKDEKGVKPGPPTKIEFFQEGLNNSAYRSGVKVSLSTKCCQNPSGTLTDKMNSRRKNGKSLCGRGVSGSLYSLLFCLVDGVMTDAFENQNKKPWKEVFLSNNLPESTLGRALVSCHAEGSDLTLSWNAMKTSGGISERAIEIDR